ncbi:MAG: hypothetical protein IJF33_07355, partial [Clostridia bacterium]|nr:hypothetical protein [Clostridia bacterium]
QTVVAPRDMLGGTGHMASMYTKTTANGTYLINALWIPAENSIYGVGQVKVTAEPLRDTDLSVFDPASASDGNVESLLIQIGLDEVKDDGSDANTVNGGMAYAYRLSDGSFFLIDGGGNDFGSGDMDKDNAARIYQTLKKYSATEKIVIAGWYITHPHTDHMGAFMAFVADYVNSPDYDVTLEKVICNLPNITEQTYKAAGRDYSLAPEKIEIYSTCLDTLREAGVNVYKTHVGQTYYVRNLTVEILFTYDLLSPKLPDAFFYSNSYIQMKDPGVIQNNTGGNMDFTNTFSVVAQATLKVDEDTSYKALWTGDQTCFGIMTVNSMYGFAMKSDFVQVMHHGYTQMNRGTEGDELQKYAFEIAVNHFFGSSYEAWQDKYDLATFADCFAADGSYGYVRAKYVLWPSHIKNVGQYIDTEEGDDPSISDSRLTTWAPLNHLQMEAKAQGGDVYAARNYLTIFTLGETVTVAIDRDVITTPMPQPTVEGSISSAEDFAAMSESGTYYLTNDITITDPDGTLFVKDFSGVLDGKGHTITIVYSKTTATTFDAQSGFVFANLKNATVKNLTITGPRMAIGSATGQYGILARRATGKVLIENVHVIGASITESETPNANVGGFIGDTDANSEVIIRNSSFEGTIEVAHVAGGLIARAGTSSSAATSVLIEGCTVSGTLSTTGQRVGGFVAQVNVSDSCRIINCESKATVDGKKLAGGFVGLITAGPVTLNGCSIAATPTGATANEWVASGTAEIVNCSKG